MSVTPLSIGQVLTLLRETPSHIAALTADLSSEELRMRPAPDEWSVNEVLAHLCADVWDGCMMKIIVEDRPQIQAVNPQAWIKQTDYPELAFQPSLRAFTAQRTDLLAVLEPLPSAAWQRSATVTGAGRPLERTVLTYAERMAVHVRWHLKQIARIVNTVHATKEPEGG